MCSFLRSGTMEGDITLKYYLLTYGSDDHLYYWNDNTKGVTRTMPYTNPEDGSHYPMEDMDVCIAFNQADRLYIHAPWGIDDPSGNEFIRYDFGSLSLYAREGIEINTPEIKMPYYY